MSFFYFPIIEMREVETCPLDGAVRLQQASGAGTVRVPPPPSVQPTCRLQQSVFREVYQQQLSPRVWIYIYLPIITRQKRAVHVVDAESRNLKCGQHSPETCAVDSEDSLIYKLLSCVGFH